MSSTVKHTKLLWPVVVAVLAVVSAGTQGIAVAKTQQHDGPKGEKHPAADEHATEHYHKHHIAVFVGATEAEEHAGEKEDPQFTLGLDYERRLSELFGVGGMFDWVIEGEREILIGPMGFVHAYKGLRFYTAPCYQRAREGGHEGFVFRVGGTWDFEIGEYSISPHLIYDLTEEENFRVVGVGVGRGF